MGREADPVITGSHHTQTDGRSFFSPAILISRKAGDIPFPGRGDLRGSFRSSPDQNSLHKDIIVALLEARQRKVRSGPRAGSHFIKAPVIYFLPAPVFSFMDRRFQSFRIFTVSEI